MFAAPAGPTRVAYLRSTLASLDESIGGRLIIRVGEPGEQLLALAREVGATSLFATRDFGPKGVTRDEGVRKVLSEAGVDVHFVDSPYVVAPGTVLTKAGTPCRVFGAFQRGWETTPMSGPVGAPDEVSWVEAPSAGLGALNDASSSRRPWYFAELPDGPSTWQPAAGEQHAQEHLADFVRRVDDYADLRNLPSEHATSRLSAYLRFGALHPRQVLEATRGTSSGRHVFRSEICWREFYADVLFHNPSSVWKVLQPTLEHLRVDRDEAGVERFRLWARGETGYPLVDAGMRQLIEEGWMHNRVRMVCASFLVKHLHLDWRWGARWFMWRLVDGDVASNQHGWQWTAGTGTDAAPFHRVFNPTLQAERFDPEGVYVHRYIDALVDVPAPQCLQPGGGEGLLAPVWYSPPMIDARVEREEALARFAEARALFKVAT
jgi:deoxyribodipyrimidine photo-lyase